MADFDCPIIFIAIWRFSFVSLVRLHLESIDSMILSKAWNGWAPTSFASLPSGPIIMKVGVPLTPLLKPSA